MPPETWTAEPGTNGTKAADVFALGCVVWRLLVGDDVPWHASAREIDCHGQWRGVATAQGVRRSLTELQRSGRNPHAKALLKKLLEPDPKERPTLATLLASDQFLRDAATALRARQTQVMHRAEAVADKVVHGRHEADATRPRAPPRRCSD